MDAGTGTSVNLDSIGVIKGLLYISSPFSFFPPVSFKHFGLSHLTNHPVALGADRYLYN